MGMYETQMIKPRELIKQALAQETEECIDWPFALDRGGYAHIRIDGKDYGVHRMVCQRKHGPCPPNLRDAAHSCNRRKCINHRHLKWKTRSGNSMDRVADGTANRGQRHGKVVLSDEQVNQLREAYAERTNISEMARQMGVNISTAAQAARGRNWGWKE